MQLPSTLGKFWKRQIQAYITSTKPKKKKKIQTRTFIHLWKNTYFWVMTQRSTLTGIVQLKSTRMVQNMRNNNSQYIQGLQHFALNIVHPQYENSYEKKRLQYNFCAACILMKIRTSNVTSPSDWPHDYPPPHFQTNHKKSPQKMVKKEVWCNVFD